MTRPILTNDPQVSHLVRKHAGNSYSQSLFFLSILYEHYLLYLYVLINEITAFERSFSRIMLTDVLP